MATLPHFDENTCGKCAKQNNGQPPCIRTQHMADRTGKFCLRVIDSPGGLCGYHAQWEHLAGDLLNAPQPASKSRPEVPHGTNWVAYHESSHPHECSISSKLILGELKKNLTRFMASREVIVQGNTQGHGLSSVMLYDPFVGAQCRYERRGDQVLALDQYAILRATPYNPRFYKVLEFFNRGVTASKPSETEWDPDGCKTVWKFDTYGSGGVSSGIGAAGGGTLVLIAPDGKKWRYLYGGGGPAVSAPIPLPSGGPEAFPTAGHIQKNPDIPELSVNSFCGACSFTDASVVVALGLSGTILTTGINPTKNPKYTAHIYMSGLSAGGAIGANRCVGAITLLGPA